MPSPALAAARSTASSIPSVANSISTPPCGGGSTGARWVTTTIGASAGGRPPQPPVWSYSRRPTRKHPTRASASRKYDALGSARRPVRPPKSGDLDRTAGVPVEELAHAVVGVGDEA